MPMENIEGANGLLGSTINIGVLFYQIFYSTITKNSKWPPMMNSDSPVLELFRPSMTYEIEEKKCNLL